MHGLFCVDVNLSVVPWESINLVFRAHFLQQNKPYCLETDELNIILPRVFNPCLILLCKLISKHSYKVLLFHNYKEHTNISGDKSKANGKLTQMSVSHCLKHCLEHVLIHIVLYIQGTLILFVWYSIAYPRYANTITIVYSRHANTIAIIYCYILKVS